MSKKNSNDTIGNRTRELRACSLLCRTSCNYFVNIFGSTKGWLDFLYKFYLKLLNPRRVQRNITVHLRRSSCKKLSVALVRKRTIPTERPPPVGEVSANFCGYRGVTWSAHRIPTAVNICFLDRSRYFLFK